MFVGRNKELAVLEERYVSGKFELCVMYGRRRVGKTSLVTEFIRNKRAVCFTAMETGAEENLLFLSQSIAENSRAPIFQNFVDACKRIFEMGRKERLVFVIDGGISLSINVKYEPPHSFIRSERFCASFCSGTLKDAALSIAFRCLFIRRF
jgi:AAA+ ATPase superfamily predicted ATPase